MKVLVVDDHQLFLDGLRHTLTQLDEDTEIVAVSSANGAISSLDKDARFDLILLDLSMPGMDGPTFLQGLAERGLLIPTVIVSAEENPRRIQQVLQQGALGFIPKSHSAEQMLAAINSVFAGNIYLPVDIARSLNRLERQQSHLDCGDSTPTDIGITKRQQTVLELMAKGYSNKKIATTLYVSEHTVKSHVSVLFEILARSNRTECVLEAMRLGLIPAAKENWSRP